MHILIATDKFKGSLTSEDVARAISRGLARSLPEAEITSVPVADGGEGTTSALRHVLGGLWASAPVFDPLGRPIEARYALAKTATGTTAIMEMSASSGFERVLDTTPDPWRASTFGTGQLIAHAVASGAGKIILGIGGSATNDGGSGMARALGFQFLDASGNPIQNIPAQLSDAVGIIPPEPLSLPEIHVACDVTNPLLGPTGATRIYGPQKGIAAEDFDRHELRLAHLATLAKTDLGHDFADSAGAGAAGGLGFGLLTFADARLHPGFDLVAETIGLGEKISTADLIITGEGKIDAQSLSGKAPAGVAKLARELGKPVVAICGIADDADQIRAAFDLLLPIRPPGMSLAQSIEQAANLIESKVAQSAPQLKELAAS